METLARLLNVNRPLIGRYWGWAMTENVRRMETDRLVVAAAAIATLVIILAHDLFGAGGFFGHNSADLQRLQQQLEAVARQQDEQSKDWKAQFSRLNEKIDTGPRVDQLQNNTAAISSTNGSVASIEARTRALEMQNVDILARLKGIESASGMQLRR